MAGFVVAPDVRDRRGRRRAARHARGGHAAGRRARPRQRRLHARRPLRAALQGRHLQPRRLPQRLPPAARARHRAGRAAARARARRAASSSSTPVVDEITDKAFNDIARLREPAHRRHYRPDELEAIVGRRRVLRAPAGASVRRTIDLDYWLQAAAVPPPKAALIRGRFKALPVEVQMAHGRRLLRPARELQLRRGRAPARAGLSASAERHERSQVRARSTPSAAVRPRGSVRTRCHGRPYAREYNGTSHARPGVRVAAAL